MTIPASMHVLGLEPRAEARIEYFRLALPKPCFHRSLGVWTGVASDPEGRLITHEEWHLRERDWLRALLTLAMAAMLMAPGLVMGLLRSHVTLDWGASILGISFPLYVAVAGGSAGAALLAPSRYSPLAAAASAVLALPRLFVYDSTLLCAGTLAEKRAQGRSSAPRDPTRTW